MGLPKTVEIGCFWPRVIQKIKMEIFETRCILPKAFHTRSFVPD